MSGLRSSRVAAAAIVLVIAGCAPAAAPAAPATSVDIPAQESRALFVDPA